MTINPIVQNYFDYVLRVLPTGSRVISPSTVTDDSDEDYLLLVSPDKLSSLEERLLKDDWQIGGSMAWMAGNSLKTEHTLDSKGGIDMSHVFHSWKRRENPGVFIHGDLQGWPPDLGHWEIEPSGLLLNLIITCNERYFDDFTRATFLAKKLSLTKKADRIIIFEALTRDVWPT